MKLYMHAAACSLSPHIVCRELGLPVDLVEVDRKTHRTGDGADFLAVNGNGYVPVLELDDGETIIEGPVIVQYLADRRPEAGLLPPPETPERRRVQTWLNFVTSELHKPMALLFKPEMAAVHDELRAMVGKRLDWASGRLQGPYLTGDRFTVADAYLFVCLNWTPWIGLELARWPALSAFVRTVGGREAVREALAAEGLVAHGPAGMFFAPEIYVSAGRQAAR